MWKEKIKLLPFLQVINHQSRKSNQELIDKLLELIWILQGAGHKNSTKVSFSQWEAVGRLHAQQYRVLKTQHEWMRNRLRSITQWHWCQEWTEAGERWSRVIDCLREDAASLLRAQEVSGRRRINLRPIVVEIPNTPHPEPASISSFKNQNLLLPAFLLPFKPWECRQMTLVVRTSLLHL